MTLLSITDLRGFNRPLTLVSAQAISYRKL
jgi:hypothetical protein